MSEYTFGMKTNNKIRGFFKGYYLMFTCLLLFSPLFAQGAVSYGRDLREDTKESAVLAPYNPFSQEANTFGKNDKIRAGRSGQFFSFLESLGLYSPSPKDIRFSQVIGKLIYNGNHGGCTASLVGSRAVLTAAHCLLKDEDSKILYGDYSFCLAYKDGDCIASSPVTRFFLGSTNLKNREDDWALLEIEDPLGLTYGFFGARKLNSLSDEINEVEQAGYGDDFFNGETLSRSPTCRIRSYSSNSKLFYHDCDTSRGDSGSPILHCEQTECTIAGLVVSEYRGGGESSLRVESYSSERANVAINVSVFSKGITDLRNSIYDSFLKPFEESVSKKPDPSRVFDALRQPVLKVNRPLKKSI